MKCGICKQLIEQRGMLADWVHVESNKISCGNATPAVVEPRPTRNERAK